VGVDESDWRSACGVADFRGDTCPVRIFNFLLFESSLEGSSAQLRSDDRFNSLLGCADQLAFHVIADQISTAGTLFIQVLESADGVTWNGRPCHAFITLTPGVSSRTVLRDAGTAPATST
jgi:hypothetical protein